MNVFDRYSLKLSVYICAASLSLLCSSNAEIKPDFSPVKGELSVIAHSPASSGKYIGSPSICILPDGTYVASHDYFGPKADHVKSPETVVYRSTDKGKTWEKAAEFPMFWGGLFYHKDALYIMGTCRGDCVIRKSTDGGKTWTEPTNTSNGLIRKGRYHTSTTNVLFAQGRIWRAMEVDNLMLCVFSIPENKDLLNGANWARTKPIEFPQELKSKIHNAWLEGNAVERVADGKIFNILRVNSTTDDIAAMVEVESIGMFEVINKNSLFIRLPGACKKFTIHYDPETKKYFSLTNWIPESMRCVVKEATGNPYGVERTRNTVAVASSTDLENWKVDYIAFQGPDPLTQAFQYVDWAFDGDDIVVASRTSWFDGEAQAHSTHDANFLTFHRIKDFRKSSGKQKAK